MNSILKRVLEIDDKEVTPVLLLLANSFFIGVFIVSYDVAANTIFLNTFGTEYLTRIPIFSGALGMISTSIFAYFQRRLPFTRLTLYCFSIITIIVAALFFGLEFYDSRALKFVSYLLLGPINTIFILCFYGTVSRSFSLKRERHMTGTVDQGQMIATAIAYFTIPLVSGIVVDITKFFIASVISGSLAFVFMFIFLVKYGINAQLERSITHNQRASNTELAASPYVRMLAMVFFGSVLATIFLEYSFLTVTVEKYKDQDSLASFLGIYGGLVTVFSVILQTFVADRVIKLYGMKISLILIPSILGLFAILASLIGTFFGYTANDSSFILFFLFMAMSKLFLQSLKEAFEDPIVKNLFIPLDSKKRYDIQTKIEGFFKEFSGFIAGTLLTIVSYFSFVNLIFYSYFLAAICAFYFYVVIRLFVEYRKNLTEALLKQQGKEAESDKKEYEVTDVLIKELETGNVNTIIYTLKLLEKIEPIMAEGRFTKYLNDQNKDLRQYSLLRLESNRALKAIEEITKLEARENDPEIKLLASKALKELNNTDRVEIGHLMTYTLVKSKKVETRIYAARLIAKTTEDAYLPQLMLLLRDLDPKVRFAAMISSAQMQRTETWPILIEYLSSYTFCNVSAAALITFGELVLPALEAAFYKTNQSATIQEKIVQIYGRIQGDKVISLLWNKIDFPDKKIVNNVLLCLSSCGFRPEGDRIVRIKQQIESEIGNSAWNIAALTEIPQTEETILLKQALEEEIAFNFENIYMLLALIYDSQAIKLVKDNIESGTVEGLVYAIELIDVFMAEELKPIFLPLIEDISQSERTERLQGSFPRQKLDSIEVLKQIINRDYNKVNKWTKACAMYCYANMQESEMCDDLTANLFNPDPLLREISAWSIVKKDYYSYKQNSNRLVENIRKELDSQFLNATHDENEPRKQLSRIEKIFFLKELPAFKNVPGVILVEFVELIEEVIIKKDAVILDFGATGQSPLYIIVKGNAEVKSESGEIITIIGEKEMIGEMLILDTDHNHHEIIASEDCILFKIDKDRFLEQITDNFEIAKELIQVISSKFKAIEEIKIESKEVFES
ncbi:MAG: cyclic nucleotide-binding domain-containing protein [Cytophagales bacterium]